MDPLGFKTILITCLIFVPLERLLALHPNQKIFRRGWHTDVIYLLLNGALIKLGLLGVIFAVAFLSSWVVPASFRELVSSQPYWLQLVEAIILSDIGFYWTHRTFHAVPWLCDQLKTLLPAIAKDSRTIRLEKDPAVGAVQLALGIAQGRAKIPAYRPNPI